MSPPGTNFAGQVIPNREGRRLGSWASARNWRDASRSTIELIVNGYLLQIKTKHVSRAPQNQEKHKKSTHNSCGRAICFRHVVIDPLLTVLIRTPSTTPGVQNIQGDQSKNRGLQACRCRAVRSTVHRSSRGSARVLLRSE